MQDVEEAVPGGDRGGECIPLAQAKVCAYLGISADTWDLFARSENW